MFKIDTFAYNVYFNISMHLLNGNYILDSAQGRVSFWIYGTETSGIAAIRAEGAAYPYNKKSPPMAGKADKNRPGWVFGGCRRQIGRAHV